MAQPQIAETLKKQRKICVVGSTGYSGATSVEWSNISSVNLVDFEAVIVNVGTLPLDGWTEDSGIRVRTHLSRFIASGGTLVVVGTPQQTLPSRTTNYSWCPINIQTQNEPGDTIDIKDTTYPKLNSFFTRWNFYFILAGTLRTDQLHHAVQSRELTFSSRGMVENRYGGMLFGEVKIHNKGQTLTQFFSKVLLFALSEGQEHQKIITVILEEVFSVAQTTLPPAWADSVTVPRLIALLTDIDKKNAEIEAIASEKAKLENEKREISEYKKLLYADGKELEEIFARCLRELGGTVKPAQYAQEEYVLEYNGESYLIECKGNKKSISLTDLRQLFDYLIEFEDANGKPGKGILFGNAWKERPPTERGTESTVIFPDNVRRRVTSFEIALVNSVDFFHAFMGFLEDEVSGDSILSRITATAGVVDFSK